MAKFSHYFKVISPQIATTTMTDSESAGDQGTYANFSWYQRLVQGSASRITRYREYDLMDNDIEIARSLDTIAEEMIGCDPNSDLPLELVIDQEKDTSITPVVAQTLKAALRYWNTIHDWNNRMFKLARVTIKYGDCFFIRKREALKWEYVHPKNVVAAIVDEHDITRVVGWQIRKDQKSFNQSQQASPYGNQTSDMVDVYTSDEVVWFSLNDDISESAPFGDSVLRAVYRSQKQKELLEDAIIIYRIQRAPERRAFYIDVGKMPPHRVKSYLEQFKNEIRQRKIPSSGGGVDQVDSVYNPQAMSEDFFFAARADGAGTKVETLQGGQGLGELADLEYFQGKVFRGLRIPMSYMKEGQDGGVINDGKTGIAYIQEMRFAMYIKRLQGYITRVLDAEFKRYLKHAGINADPTTFRIKLCEPENFGIYRQQQLHNDLLSTFSQASATPYISPRYAMSTFLQMSDEQILRNERMRREELGLDPNGGIEDLPKIYALPDQNGDMGGMGGGGMIAGTMGGMGGMGGDMGMMGDPGMGTDGGMGAPGADAQNSAAGGQPLPPQQ